MAKGINQKIKLVIWDLDETLWEGILAEGDDVKPFTNRFDIIKILNRRGIVNAIVSKNKEDQAKKKLISFGMWDEFVFPKISFNPKGPVIKDLISTMALRPVNVLFVDDNDSNLNEALHYCPDLNCINAADVDDILNNKYLKGKDDSQLSRLEQYKQLEKRVEASSNYSSNEEFLRNCNIRVSIIDYEPKYLDRAFELVDRTNQLNYTKKRPTIEEFEVFMSKSNVKGYLLGATDNFGDNGLIGFYAFESNVLTHYCFSCRTLGYRIEQWLYMRLGCPDLETVGEVAISLNKIDNPDWIHLESSESVDTSSLKEIILDNPIRVLAVGPCYIQKMISLLSIAHIDVKFVYRIESAVNNTPITYAFDSTSYLSSCLQMDSICSTKLLKHVQFAKYSEYFSNSIASDVDYIIIAPAFEYQFEFSQLIDNPKLCFNSDLVSLAGIQSTNVLNSHVLSPSEIFKNLENIIDKVDSKTKIIIFKEPQNISLKPVCEGRGSDKYYARFCDYQRLVDVNNAIIDFSIRHKDRVLICDLDKFIQGPSDCENHLNHWSFEKQVQIANEIIGLLHTNHSRVKKKSKPFSLIADDQYSLEIKTKSLLSYGLNIKSGFVSNNLIDGNKYESNVIIDCNINNNIIESFSNSNYNLYSIAKKTNKVQYAPLDYMEMGKAYISSDLDRAIDCFKKAGDVGSTSLLWTLLKKTTPEAYNEARIIAENIIDSPDSTRGNISAASYVLSIIYYCGNGVKIDYDKSIYYCQKCAFDTYPHYDYLLKALINRNKPGDFEYAQSIINYHIKKGDKDALKWMGRIFNSFPAPFRDVSKSCDWYRLAINNGINCYPEFIDVLWKINSPLADCELVTIASHHVDDPVCAAKLGYAYMRGRGVKQDFAKAASLMEKYSIGKRWWSLQVLKCYVELNDPLNQKPLELFKEYIASEDSEFTIPLKQMGLL